MTVYTDGKVVVTAPVRAPEKVIEKFVAEKEGWILKKVTFFKKQNPSGKPVRKFTRKDYLANKDMAYALVTERVRVYAKLYGLSYHKISIKNQKTRWGSCSRQKNLTFNYKIAFLPKEYQDYIVVHEICHLQEMNHSKNFWALVAQTFPDYKTLKKSLRHPNQLYI